MGKLPNNHHLITVDLPLTYLCANMFLIYVLVILGCVKQPSPSPKTVVTAEMHKYTLNYGGLFDVRLSESMYDNRLLDPNIFQRVLFEPDIFHPDIDKTRVELWSRRLFLSKLGGKGALIIAPPLPASANPHQPCLPKGCYQPAPTSVVRSLVFEMQDEEVEVIVSQDKKQEINIALRLSDKDKSICPNDLKVRLEYIQLDALVHRYHDGATLALIHEIALLPAQEAGVVKQELPLFSQQPKAFCQAVANIFVKHPQLQASQSRQNEAANGILKTVFGRLFPKSQVPSKK